MIRIGLGYDVHPLVEGLPLMIGGIEIPFDKGLDGFSDADVALHALADALLGAVALGDVGTHFPPGDPRWKDADSADLLRHVFELVQGEGFRVINCDLTVIAEAPKLSPYKRDMQRRIAELLEIDSSDVNIKATTHEKLGPIGRGEGIAAHAVALLEKPDRTE